MDNKKNTSGRVVSVNVSKAKGESKIPVPEIVIDKNGVIGDAHAGPWHRQVSLLALESIEKFSAASEHTFNHGDFAENLSTQGLDLPAMNLLDRLTIGPVELEVTQIGKKCHGDGCAIYQQVGKCVMPREGIFCRVVKGGGMRAGETIRYAPRTLHCRVITLSDRAAEGVYADRSGPAAETLLRSFCASRQWEIDITRELLPDNAERLRAALLEARYGDVNVVVTTGGTGIGPRDITPGVVTGLADKLIPGIMEQIRISSGARKPNALLSRSVAAVIGTTLVYALPGSTKAVEEYMESILETLEHAVLMVHGLDAH